MDKATKLEQSATLRQGIEDVSALVLVEYSGLTVLEAEELRGQFREAGCTYKVYKNSVIKYAVTESTHEPLMPLLKGMNGLAYNAEDPGAPARVAREYSKKNEKLKVKGGVIDGQFLDKNGVDTLASMPGPNELKSQLLALLMTPATQMVRVLNAPLQNVLNVLNAKKDKEAA